MTSEVEARFWGKVNRDSDCWEWTASKTWDGYGQFGFAGTMVRAHRFAYTLEVGEIPEGLQLDHLCRNRSCVNPEHLEAVTTQENTRRGVPRTGPRKTECPKGHPYTPENARIYQGKQHCRTCDRIRSRKATA